jgi:beta-glucosidase
LSYTSFEISAPALSKSAISATETIKVTATVKNTGKVKGDEVVQLYVRDLVSSVTRPVKELRDFRRITLEPGESKTIEMEITPDKLSFYNIDKKFVVEPGEFEVMVGNSSRDEDLKKVLLTVQ